MGLKTDLQGQFGLQQFLENGIVFHYTFKLELNSDLLLVPSRGWLRGVSRHLFLRMQKKALSVKSAFDPLSIYHNSTYQRLYLTLNTYMYLHAMLTIDRYHF